MSLEALLLIRDPEALRVFRKVLDANGISAQVCDDCADAQERLARHKYDAVVVDCDDIPDAPAALRELRAGKANKHAIAFALTNGTTTVKSAYEMGANFVIDKPFTVERLQRSMRAAQ